jgi:hypothetical protein
MAAAEVNIDVVRKLRREIILFLLESNADKTLSFPGMRFVSDHHLIHLSRNRTSRSRNCRLWEFKESTRAEWARNCTAEVDEFEYAEGIAQGLSMLARNRSRTISMQP